jgi:iron(III) transport system permease protein
VEPVVPPLDGAHCANARSGCTVHRDHGNDGEDGHQASHDGEAVQRRIRTVVAEPRRAVVYQGLVWVTVVGLVIAPLAPIAYSSLQSKPFYLPGSVFTFDAYRTLFADPAYWKAVRNSVEFATLLTGIAVPVGTIFAILCHRTDLPLASWFSRLLLAPIVIPPLGLIVGWFVLYGDGGYLTQALRRLLHVPTWQLSSIPGMAVLGAAVATPIVYVTCRAALEGKGTAFEQAAASLGARPVTVLLRITLPMLRPAVLNCAVLVFALGLEVLGIPLLLGSPSNIDMYGSYLYKAWISGLTPDPPYVSAGALLLLLAVTALLLLRGALLGSERRFGALGSRGEPPFRPLALGAWRYPLAIGTATFIAMMSLIPLLGLVLMSVVSQLTILVPPWQLATVENWQHVIFDSRFQRSIVNSLVIGLLGAGMTVILVAVATLIAHRSNFPLRATIAPALVYPRSVPGIVLGIGFFWAFLIVDLPGGLLRNSIVGELIALSVRSSTLAYIVIYPSVVRINIEFDRAARAAGAGWWTAVRRILLPMLRPALVAAFVLVFVTIVSDYDPVVFLQKPGTEVMGVTMLQFWTRGVVGSVAALAVIQLGIVAVVISMSWRVLGRTLNA